MDSATPRSSSDVQTSPPLLIPLNSSYTEEGHVNHGFESDHVLANQGIWRRLLTRNTAEMAVKYFAMACLIWFFGMYLIESLHQPKSVWLGPNSSMLVESNSILFKTPKVEEVDYSNSGLQLFGFYRTPPLNVFVNWSESRLLTIPQDSYKGWPYYLNEGATLNISYIVKPLGSAVQLVVNEGTQGISQESLKQNDRDTAWPWNLIHGNGKLDLEISKSSSYYIILANLKSKDIEVELNIDVKAVLYNTSESLYNCTFINGECTFNSVSNVGNFIVVTSPSPSLGASTEDEWFIRFSFEQRWTAYVTVAGMIICYAFVAIKISRRLSQSCSGEERTYHYPHKAHYMFRNGL